MSEEMGRRINGAFAVNGLLWNSKALRVGADVDLMCPGVFRLPEDVDDGRSNSLWGDRCVVGTVRFPNASPGGIDLAVDDYVDYVDTFRMEFSG